MKRCGIFLSLVLCFPGGTFGEEVHRKPGHVWVEKKQAPVGVSFIQLLANPEKFHGKFISVRGVLVLDPHKGVLHLSEDLARYESHNDTIWVRISETFLPRYQYQEFNRQPVVIAGTFYITDRMHFFDSSYQRAFPGTIDELSRIRVVERSRRWDDPGVGAWSNHTLGVDIPSLAGWTMRFRVPGGRYREGADNFEWVEKFGDFWMGAWVKKRQGDYPTALTSVDDLLAYFKWEEEQNWSAMMKERHPTLYRESIPQEYTRTTVGKEEWITFVTTHSVYPPVYYGPTTKVYYATLLAKDIYLNLRFVISKNQYQLDKTWEAEKHRTIQQILHSVQWEHRSPKPDEVAPKAEISPCSQ